MRRIFALVVVALHVLVLALLMSSGHPDMIQDLNSPVFVSLWIPEVVPEPPERLLATPPLTQPTRTAPAASRNPALVDEPPAAESVPVQSTAISIPVPGPAPAPQVDWAREGKLAARRAAEKGGDEQPATFSPPPKTVPKPCKPKESSMEWNGKEDRQVSWAGPIPVVKVGKRCVWALVFVACNLSEIPEANSHLLDDMRAADRPRSSVPDPNICD